MASGVVAKRENAAVANLDPVNVELYPALVDGIDGMLEALSENVGSALELADLVRIKVPSGGTTMWEVPDVLGDSEMIKVVEIVPVYWSDARVWWPEPGPGEPDISNEPPHCWSTDGKSPDPAGTFGDDGLRAQENLPIAPIPGAQPQRMCKGCPMDEWGSDYKGGRGKACKQQKLIFGLREGETLPVLIPVPPGSLRSVRSAMIRLTAKTQSHYSGFRLGFSLEKKKNKAGQEYGEIQVKLLGALSGVRPTKQGGPEADTPAALSKAYSDAFGKLLTPDVLAAVARQDDTDEPATDGLGGDFADHGEPAGT